MPVDTLEKLESPPYVQIQGKLEKSFDTIELRKEGVIDWLFQNGYQEEALKIGSCGTQVVQLECSDGHKKLVRMTCHREFCFRCGMTNSLAHKKRYHRVLDRLLWSEILGYVVFTFPKEVSDSMPDRLLLGTMEKETSRIIKENFNAPGHMVRFHLMGNKVGDLHIHINVLFPITETNGKGEVPQEVLNNVRQEWTNYLNVTFSLANKTTNVFYKFAVDEIQKRHIASYVTRPIITSTKFLSLSDSARHYVLSLQGWHNTRWFGKLSNCKYKEFLESRGIDHEKSLNEDVALSKVCPVCHQRFRFMGTADIRDVLEEDYRKPTNDVWVDRAIFEALNPSGSPGED